MPRVARWLLPAALSLALLVAPRLTRPALAAPATSAAASAAPEPAADAKDRSRAAFRQGVEQLRARDWARARQSFEQAYALYPHPSILLNLAIARLRTGEPVLAEQDLLRFLGEDGGASPDELAGAREALAEARAGIGTLRVAASPRDATILVDGPTVEDTRVRCAAGRHDDDVSAEGHTAATREVDVVAREESVVEVVLAPERKEAPGPEPDRGGRTALGLGAAGVATVAFVAAGFSALRASALADDYVDRASARFQDAETRSEGITYRTAADVALGVGIVAGATAIVLLVTDFGAPPSTSRAVTTAGRGVVVRW